MESSARPLLTTEALGESVLRVTPLLRVFAFDSSGDRHQGMCELTSAEGSTARFAVSSEVLEVLGLFDGVRCTDAVLSSYLEPPSARFDRAALERLVDGFLVPRGLLIPAAAEVIHPSGSVTGRAPYLHLQVELFPARFVLPVARRLTWLFEWYVAAPLLALVAAAHFVYAGNPVSSSISAADIHGTEVIAVILITMATAVVHELGHAAAGARYGCERVSIGWGVYYYVAVFFTDLSEAWRLPREKRVLVDAAGMYFQALSLVVLLLGFYATGWDLLLHCFLLVELMIASSLNPFFRMDGYWLVSDGLGIPNLRSQSGRLLQSLRAGLLGGSGPAPRWEMSPGVRWLLGAYTIGSVAFFGYVTWAVLNGWGVALARAYPETLLAVWNAAGAEAFSPGRLASSLVDAVWRGLILFGISMFLLRLVRAVLRGTAGSLRSTFRRAAVV